MKKTAQILLTDQHQKNISHDWFVCSNLHELTKELENTKNKCSSYLIVIDLDYLIMPAGDLIYILKDSNYCAKYLIDSIKKITQICPKIILNITSQQFKKLTPEQFRKTHCLYSKTKFSKGKFNEVFRKRFADLKTKKQNIYWEDYENIGYPIIPCHIKDSFLKRNIKTFKKSLLNKLFLLVLRIFIPICLILLINWIKKEVYQFIYI